MRAPLMVKLRRDYDRTCILDIEARVRAEVMAKMPRLAAKARVAVATGSRGIAHIDRIVKATVDALKELGYSPFIVPAMGSHGGATAEGQRQTIESYGITEERMGASILSSLDVVELPREDCPVPVYMDAFAYKADATVVVNRVKIHTDFHSVHESGIVKMCVIGLGKHAQALAIHRYGVYGLSNYILPAARQVLKHGNIALGLAILENAYDQPQVIQAVLPADFEAEDRRLLDLNRRTAPRLPADDIDLLFVDQLGKNISGTGLDTNVIGRTRVRDVPEPQPPRIKAIIVSDLTPESHGNALGMGLADFITKKLADKIDFAATYENGLTSSFNQRAHMPVVASNEQQAFAWTQRIWGPVDVEQARIVRIKNTLELTEFYVSEPMLDEVLAIPGTSALGEAAALFDSEGGLPRF